MECPVSPEVVIDRNGPSGNIWAVMGLATNALKDAGERDQAHKLSKDFAFHKGEYDYEEMLEMIGRYVDLVIID